MRNSLKIPQQHCRVVFRGLSHKDARVGALQALDRVAACLHAFVDRLEQNALLGVHGLGFARVDTEKVVVKRPDVFRLVQKVGMSSI